VAAVAAAAAAAATGTRRIEAVALVRPSGRRIEGGLPRSQVEGNMQKKGSVGTKIQFRPEKQYYFESMLLLGHKVIKHLRRGIKRCEGEQGEKRRTTIALLAYSAGARCAIVCVPTGAWCTQTRAVGIRQKKMCIVFLPISNYFICLATTAHSKSREQLRIFTFLLASPHTHSCTHPQASTTSATHSGNCPAERECVMNFPLALFFEGGRAGARPISTGQI
jgi:hypothetical protein